MTAKPHTPNSGASHATPTTPSGSVPQTGHAPQGVDLPPEIPFRIGQGYDLHVLVEGRPLIIGGVHVEHPLGLAGHSDADVLAHAITDALLGAAGLGDIGQHFPDSQARFEGISSAVLLDQVLEMLRGAGVTPCHADLAIVAQTPRLSPFREEIRKNVARLLGLDKTHVNIKATTEEGLGFTGRAEGIKVYAVVSALTGAAPSFSVSLPSPDL